jgi:hypothetical protein
MKANKNNILFLFLQMTLMLMVIPNYAYSEPMRIPTREEALRSNWIVIAQYISHKESLSGKIDYFHGPIAQYKIIRVLSGNNLNQTIDVRYDFQDGSACLALENWKFTEDTMPQTNSEWILFLEQENGIFTTYRGDYGRWEATRENIKEIEHALRNKK